MRVEPTLRRCRLFAPSPQISSKSFCNMKKNSNFKFVSYRFSQVANSKKIIFLAFIRTARLISEKNGYRSFCPKFCHQQCASVRPFAKTACLHANVQQPELLKLNFKKTSTAKKAETFELLLYSNSGPANLRSESEGDCKSKGKQKKVVSDLLRVSENCQTRICLVGKLAHASMLHVVNEYMHL